MLLALLICFSLCACGEKENDAANTLESVEETSSDTESSAAGDPESSKEYTGAGIGDNDKDNLVSVTDISAQ